jgi:tetratricopeptide (TPR) repeat protein
MLKKLKTLFSVSALVLVCAFASTLESCKSCNSGKDLGIEETSDTTLRAINAKITAEPNNFAHYLERARYYSGLKKFAEANADIVRAKAIDSTKADIYFTAGKIHFDQQRVVEAYDDYKKCLEKDPQHQEGLLEKAAMDIALNNYELALQQINSVLRQDERVAYAYYLKGRLYRQVKDTTLALSSYQTAIEVDPSYYDAYVEAGLVCASYGNPLAKEYYNSAIEIHPNFIEPYYNKAIFLQETGVKNSNNYQEALVCYDKIIGIDANFSAAYFNKGFVYLVYLKDYQKGIESFNLALEKNPNYYQAAYNRALCHEGKGDKINAEADLNLALKLKPDYTEAALELGRLRGDD